MRPGGRAGFSPSTVTSGATGFARLGRNRYSARSASSMRPSAASRDGVMSRRTASTLQQAARHPAVDGDHRARDVRGAVGGEEADHVPELPRLADTAERDARDLLRAGIRLAQPLGLDPPGADRVDRDPRGADLAGERLRPPDD